jgi:rhamnopyranosyl-N-acetylglucosaminyl-diphospho-decaprenol beta-1,3/1,4-galactofuranosyltransferase
VDRVCAVVVTWNRKELLQRCLNAISGQTHSIERIIVVNNGSTDGTGKMLESSQDARLISIELTDNAGGAAGFHVGINAAMATEAEFIWLMDDDGYPDPECLTTLISAMNEFSLAAANPLVRPSLSGSGLSFPLRVDLLQCYNLDELLRRNEHAPILLGKINPFNGLLLRRAVVERVGSVRYEMFMWGDEVEYQERISSFGFRLGTVLAANFVHPAKRSSGIRLGRLIEITLNPRVSAVHRYRNYAYNCFQYGHIGRLIVVALAHAVVMVGMGRFAQFAEFCSYSADGLLDRYRLPPSRDEIEMRMRVRSSGNTNFVRQKVLCD